MTAIRPALSNCMAVGVPSMTFLRKRAANALVFAASDGEHIAPQSQFQSCRCRFYAFTRPVSMAASSVELAPKDDLKSALANPETVILDVRSVEEIASSGYWKSGKARWVNAPGSREENRFLFTAAKAIVPRFDTPVIVCCRRGVRSAKAKEILEAQGFTNVMNAGGYPADMEGL